MSEPLTLSNRYYVKNTNNGQWTDVTTKFSGLKILSVEGMDSIGDAVNVYNEQWVDSTTEDVMVVGSNIIRKNVDLKITFICGERYGATDTQTVHDSFISYMCGSGIVYLKSAYTNKRAALICTKGYEPTTVQLKRGARSYILGTLEMHCITPPVVVSNN